jgi:hypothetical protein
MTGSAYLPKMADLNNEAGEHRTGRVPNADNGIAPDNCKEQPEICD